MHGSFPIVLTPEDLYLRQAQIVRTGELHPHVAPLTVVGMAAEGEGAVVW